jgi:hypothetical protein
MVVVFPTGKKLDFVTLTSIHYGLEQCGGPVVAWGTKNDFSKADKLCIVGHGSPGSIEGKPAAEIAQELIDRGLSKKLKKLVITSCNAGVKDSGKSVIDVLAAKLKEAGITGLTLKGANGPSVKAHILAETRDGEFHVVDPKKVAKAGEIQGRLTSSKEYEFLADLKVEASDKDLANKAVFASEVTFAFFEDFVKELAKEKLLLTVPMATAKS